MVRLSKNDVIKDGGDLYTVIGVLGSVAYAQRLLDANDSPSYELEEVVKYYRKIEIMGK